MLILKPAPLTLTQTEPFSSTRHSQLSLTTTPKYPKVAPNIINACLVTPPLRNPSNPKAHTRPRSFAAVQGLSAGRTRPGRCIACMLACRKRRAPPGRCPKDPGYRHSHAADPEVTLPHRRSRALGKRWGPDQADEYPCFLVEDELESRSRLTAGFGNDQFSALWAGAARKPQPLHSPSHAR